LDNCTVKETYAFIRDVGRVRGVSTRPCDAQVPINNANLRTAPGYIHSIIAIAASTPAALAVHADGSGAVRAAGFSNRPGLHLDAVCIGAACVTLAVHYYIARAGIQRCTIQVHADAGRCSIPHRVSRSGDDVGWGCLIAAEGDRAIVGSDVSSDVDRAAAAGGVGVERYAAAAGGGDGVADDDVAAGFEREQSGAGGGGILADRHRAGIGDGDGAGAGAVGVSNRYAIAVIGNGDVAAGGATAGATAAAADDDSGFTGNAAKNAAGEL